MSMTETRPAESPAAPPVAPAPRPAILDWFTSADHKRIGVAYLWTSLAFAAVAAVAVVVLRFELVGEGLDTLTRQEGAQWYSLLFTSAFFLFLLPAFLGLATHLVPLQLGARRLAFPRLHQWAYWVYLSGGVVVVVSYLMKGGPYAAQALLAPPGSAQAGQSSDLWLLGMGAVSVAAVAAAAGLAATIVTFRPPGMSLDRTAAFTWGTLVGSVVLALAVPVFVAGLLLHGINIHHGGTFFTDGAGPRIWQLTLWFGMRPELFATVVFGAAALSEVVPTFARRRLLSYQGALALLGAMGALSFAVWAYEKQAAAAPLAPTFSVASVLPWLPLGLLLLMWLGTLALGRPRVAAAVAFALGAVVCLAAALAGGVSGLIVDVPGGSAWAEGHTFLLLFGFPVFALSAAVYYWAPKIWGRHLNEVLGFLQFLLLVAGTLAATVPYYTGLRDEPRFAIDLTGDALNYGRIAAAGDALLVLALLVLFVNLVGAAAGKGKAAAADAWDAGATLEWLADSPPPPWNFTAGAVPPIRSEQPVLDLRTDRGEI